MVTAGFCLRFTGSVGIKGGGHYLPLGRRKSCLFECCCSASRATRCRLKQKKRGGRLAPLRLRGRVGAGLLCEPCPIGLQAITAALAQPIVLDSDTGTAAPTQSVRVRPNRDGSFDCLAHLKLSFPVYERCPHANLRRVIKRWLRTRSWVERLARIQGGTRLADSAHALGYGGYDATGVSCAYSSYGNLQSQSTLAPCAKVGLSG